MARTRPQDPEDLNLIPLMNLFVTMIPLLLLTAAFYHIGMVSVSVPTQSEEESSVETGSTAVTVNVRMAEKGFTITASSGSLNEAELKSLDAFIPIKAGKYDFETLTATLERIKRKYEQSETMILVPHRGASYNSLIKTMDAARNMTLAYQGKKRKVPLFPVVVLTSLVE